MGDAISELDLEKKRRAFRRSMAAIEVALHELARTAGIAEPTSAMNHPERFLDSVDAFLATLDTSTLGYNQRLWIQARCAFLIGELLRLRHGGTWFLQEDPKEHFYLTPVVGGFDNDPSLTVSPPAIVRKVFAQNPPRSLRQEIASLGLDDSDTAPQVDGGLLSGHHRSLVPKIRCTCGQSLWDFAGGHGGKARWLSGSSVDAFRSSIADRIGAWLAASHDGHRDAFLQHVLGMDPDDDQVDDAAVIHEIVSRAMAADIRTAFECSGCGRLWIEAGENDFVAYSPNTDRRCILEEPVEPASPDSVRMSVELR